MVPGPEFLSAQRAVCWWFRSFPQIFPAYYRSTSGLRVNNYRSRRQLHWAKGLTSHLCELNHVYCANSVPWTAHSNSRGVVENFGVDFAGLSSKQAPDSAIVAGQPGASWLARAAVDFCCCTRPTESDCGRRWRMLEPTRWSLTLISTVRH